MIKRVIVLIILLSVLFVNCFPVVAHADIWDGLKYSVSSIWDGSFFLDPGGATVNYWKKLFGVGDEPVHDAESYNTYITNNYDVTLYSSSGDYTFCPIPTALYLESDYAYTYFDIPGQIGSDSGVHSYFRFKYISSNSSGILLYVDWVSDIFPDEPLVIEGSFLYNFLVPYDGVYTSLNYYYSGYQYAGYEWYGRVHIYNFTVAGPGYITIPYPILTCDTPDFTYNNYYDQSSR